MNEEIRDRLHQLLDQMIDENKPLGSVDEMVFIGEAYRITKYRLVLHKSQETIY